MQVLVQRHNALDGLGPSGSPGSSRDRLAFRAMAMPPLPGGARGARFLLGMEVSQGLWNTTPREVRLFYGLDLSLNRLFY